MSKREIIAPNKPTMHLVRLTVAERDLVCKILDEAATFAESARQTPREVCVFTDTLLKNQTRASEIAAVFGAWHEVDGNVDIALEDKDRRVLVELIDAWGKIGERTEGAEFLEVFADFRLDFDRISDVLLAETPLYKSTLMRNSRRLQPFLYRIARDCFYKDDVQAYIRVWFRIDAIREACEVFANAGLCKLRAEPAGGRHQYPRVYIDWSAEMYLPPPGRRSRRCQFQTPFPDVRRRRRNL